MFSRTLTRSAMQGAAAPAASSSSLAVTVRPTDMQHAGSKRLYATLIGHEQTSQEPSSLQGQHKRHADDHCDDEEQGAQASAEQAQAWSQPTGEHDKHDAGPHQSQPRAAHAGKRHQQRPQPTHFLALRVSHSPSAVQAIERVQAALIAHSPGLAACNVPPVTAHISLLVMHLPDEQAVERAGSFLNGRLPAMLRERRGVELEPLRVQLRGLSSFPEARKVRWRWVYSTCVLLLVRGGLVRMHLCMQPSACTVMLLLSCACVLPHNTRHICKHVTF